MAHALSKSDLLSWWQINDRKYQVTFVKETTFSTVLKEFFSKKQQIVSMKQLHKCEY